MAAPLLYYQPNQHCQIWAAFVGAVLVHVAAIAIARTHPQSLPALESADPAVDIFLDPAPPDPLPADPIEPPPVLAPPVPDESSFPNEIPTPPPVRKTAQKQIQPLRRTSSSFSGSATMRSAKAVALYAPRPVYLYEARRHRTTGSGIAVLTVDPATGNVIAVSISQSTGSAVLDNATISAFRRWRFRPGTVARVQTPITYALTGASY